MPKIIFRCIGFRCDNEIPESRKKLRGKYAVVLEGGFPIFKDDFCSDYCEKDFIRRENEEPRINGLGNIAPECDY